MGFFKENLFFVLLAAGVILIGGVLLAVASSVGDDVEQGLKKRQDIVSKLAGELRKPRVNSAIVKVEGVRVQTVRDDANDVRSRMIDWNRKTCKPLRLPLLDKDLVVVGHVDAFPIDQDIYRDYSLRYRFTHVYLQEMEALRRRLKPTRLPKKEELDAAKEKWQHHINKEAELDTAKEEEGSPAKRDRTPRGPVPGYLPQPGSGMVGAWQPRGGSRGTGRGASEDKAGMYARRELMMRQARKGWMYVGETAMEKAFPIAVTGASDKQIWEAQLSLWVTADIVEAIVATNKEAFAKLPKTDANVSTAAVKRLMHIRTDKDYFTGGAPTRRGGGTPSGGPIYGPGGMSFGPTPGGGRPGFGAFRTPGVSQTIGKGLTGRTVGTEYDVLHYSFSVIMSEKYLPSLQKNLMTRNLHTILKVEEQEVAFNEMEMYYYGTEPVVQVTMEWELLLLTAWERGSEQTATDPSPRALRGRAAAAGRRSGDLARSAEPVRWKKKFPPLMPLKVLEWINQETSGAALRDVDRRRLDESARR